ncbi:unnamed protein product [Camellia sinensis]
MTNLRNNLLGAAITGNISWWILVLAQIVYVISGFFPMRGLVFPYCLELWYYTAVILMVGALQNPAIAVVVSHSTLLIWESHWEIVFAFESKVHIIQTTVNWIAVGAGSAS